jgi:hypothetical protein
MAQSDCPVCRQEIVFIGAGMDEAAIVALLDAALLNDDEMVRADHSVCEAKTVYPPDPPTSSERDAVCSRGHELQPPIPTSHTRFRLTQAAYCRKNWPATS